MRYARQLLMMVLSGVMVLTVLAGPRDELWKKVDEAIGKGLPKTAIESLDPIIQQSLAEKAYGEAAKAICRKIVLEGNIQGNKPEEKITRLEAEIAKAPKGMVPLLDTIQANWYWHYFLHNRWRFMQRTATAQAPGKDFTTWDLPRLFAEIGKKFQSALSAAPYLKSVPVASYDDLLVKGNMPDTYRPTLYDFIVHEALVFYSSGEQAAAKAEDVFEVFAEDPILDSMEKFLAWKPVTTDTDSPVLKVIRLYQELLQFHQADKDQTALKDADIARLVYGKNKAFGEDKNARFKKAMADLAEQLKGHELYATALYHVAHTLREEGSLVEAREMALKAEGAFRDSVGGRLCHNLIAEIESKSARITTEHVWNSCQPKLEAHYRNVTDVYFRAVAWKWESFMGRPYYYPDQLDEKDHKALLAKTPDLEWSAKLLPTKDFKERSELLPAPQTLKPGFYFIIASHDPKFSDNDNQVSLCSVWVSDLALVIRTRAGDIEGLVMDAKSGEPIAGAEIDVWRRDNNGKNVQEDVRKTDENGFFSIRPQQHRNYMIRARWNGQEVVSAREGFSAYRYDREYTHSQTIFFTDRSIYRPGQTVQYKGICVRIDQEKNDYKLLPGQRLTVSFRDPNGKEIARQENQCNDYGSFTGSFTAPRDRVMGGMQLVVDGGPNGSTYFQVEEYKRPKFQVTVDAPKTAARLNDKVNLKGKAAAYTGAAIDGAQVKYRVVREVHYPYWFYWYCWHRPRSSSSQEIAHGTTRTETDGSFKIEFAAKPDMSVSEKDEPTFSYHVNADVTDTAGETRSAQRVVNVGYTALQVTMSSGEWLTQKDPVSISLRTTTLDSEGQAAEGVIKVHRLKEPAKVQRPDPREWHRYYYGAVDQGGGPDM